MALTLFFLYGAFILLIEPYWNVNNAELAVRKSTISLLIEPYWNVNKH